MVVRPKYIFALLAVIVFALGIRLMNPHREYSTTDFWQSATVEDVADVPDEALAPGNRNGPVLMWAAMATSDPRVITALVERGADVNESDAEFAGTPLSGAAGYSNHPAIIEELVRLGADVDKRLWFDDTALMIAARYNENPAIAQMLLDQGADPFAISDNGKTALDVARNNRNGPVARVLRDAMRKADR